MVGLPASFVREETRYGNKTYFAFYQNPGGFAECYDFTTQADCSGVSSPLTWPNINGGDTRDYGYTVVTANCFVATGDMGVLWSFNPNTGSDNETSCLASDTEAAAAAVIPKALPNTGMNPDSSLSKYGAIAAVSSLAFAVLVLCRRVVNRR